MKNINIEIPKGHEIDIKNSNLEEGSIVFQKKEIKLPTTNKECIEFAPDISYSISNFIESVKECDEKLNFGNKYVMSTKELAEAFLALIQLVKFRDIWNDGWKPNYGNNITSGWIIANDNNKITWFTEYTISHVLTFQTQELVIKFLKTFKDLIEIAKPLL